VVSEQLTQEQFREHLNTIFAVPVSPDQTLELTLVECNDLGSSPKQVQFSLLFAGPPTPMIQQQTCPLRHEVIGDLSLFLVPIRRDQQHIYYEAIFNYFRKQGE
jgi:hypothetical protein